MIGVTERAKQELKKVLLVNTDETEACFRLSTDDQGQIGLAIDKEREGDQSIEHDGSKLLLAEEALADTLQGITVFIGRHRPGMFVIITYRID